LRAATFRAYLIIYTARYMTVSRSRYLTS
jgi:hypothetical protein